MSDATACPTEYGQAGYFVALPHRSCAELRSLQAHLARALPGTDVVLGGDAVAVLDYAPSRAHAEHLNALLGAQLHPAPPGIRHELGVVYDGIDLQEICAFTGRSQRDVARLHASVEYEVGLLGFLPGFAYLAELPNELRLPRLAAPRARVTAGSVAIAERYSGVYPFDSPGGWRLLGRAVEPRLFDPRESPPARLSPGDRVRFIDTPPEAAPVLPRIRPRLAPGSGRAHLVVERVTGALTVQDGGRLGQRSAGIPPSGALDLKLLFAANAALGNPSDAAAIELWLGGAIVRAEGSFWVSLDGEPKHLTDGERFEIAPGARAVRYLAVEGGVDVPKVLGSRATLLVARLGGHDGRALRPGDRLAVGARTKADLVSASSLGGAPPPAVAAHSLAPAPLDAPVLVDPGPHAHHLGARFEQLLQGEFVVSQFSDRIGLRLEPGAVAGTSFELERPAPVVRGAIQLTPNGTLVVFGPDHPVTGGYPQLAVVRPESFSTLAARRPGARIRFITSGGS